MKFVSDEWETAVMPTDGNNSFRIMEKKCYLLYDSDVGHSDSVRAVLPFL